jgi:glutathione S-transferase
MRLLYHLPLSPYCRKIRLVLAEKGLPFELRTEKPWERRPGYLAMNPSGTVPTLVESDGRVIPDSQVICEYLQEVYPDGDMLGSIHHRIEVRRLTNWLDGPFAAAVTNVYVTEKYLKRYSGQGQPDGSALREAGVNLREHLAYLGWLVETRTNLASNTLSLADLAGAAHLSVLDFTNDIDWQHFPHLRDWYARMKSRPSFRAILNDRISGMMPPDHYADLDF